MNELYDGLYDGNAEKVEKLISASKMHGQSLKNLKNFNELFEVLSENKAQEFLYEALKKVENSLMLQNSKNNLSSI